MKFNRPDAIAYLIFASAIATIYLSPYFPGITDWVKDSKAHTFLWTTGVGAAFVLLSIWVFRTENGKAYTLETLARAFGRFLLIAFAWWLCWLNLVGWSTRSEILLLSRSGVWSFAIYGFLLVSTILYIGNRSFAKQTVLIPETVLSERDRSIYDAIIASAAVAARFDDWNSWTFNALKQPPVWDITHLDAISSYRKQVFAAIWPGRLLELERALQSLSHALDLAVETVNEHADGIDGDRIRGVKFYKQYTEPFDAALSHKQTKEYGEWLTRCDDSVTEVAKAANWVAEVIRRDFQPSFRAAEGKFTLTYDLDMEMKETTTRPEYSVSEREELPERLRQASHE